MEILILLGFLFIIWSIVNSWKYHRAKNWHKIQGELIPKPDSQQRASFVVMNLIVALQHNNKAIISASCAYLLNRYPLLIEAHANDKENSIKISLVEEPIN